MDLFCWGATGRVEMQGDTPINPDAKDDPYYYNGNSNLSGVYEWGNVTISNTNLNNAGAAKWRTLTIDEWSYIFNSTTKYGFGLVEGCVGVILLPDGFVDPETNGGSGAFVNAPGTNGYRNNEYSGLGWKLMEAAGAVFLPAAGFYKDSYQNIDNSYAYYWSSTPYTEDATRAYFNMIWIYDEGSASERRVSYGYYNKTDLGFTRNTRMSVRLVRTGD